MAKRLRVIVPLLITIVYQQILQGQTITRNDLLTRMSNDFKARSDLNLSRAKLLAKQKGWFLTKHTANGGVITLVGVDAKGNPEYVSTLDNIIAAATTRASQLWPGGSSGLNLSGSSAAVKGKIAIWDGGHPLTTHVELAGRITLGDVAEVEGHPTHTTGTLIATGINPIAKGMAFGAQLLYAYDFTNDESEMAKAAPNLLVSNHSYGFLQGSGWSFDGTNWDWYGDTTISKTQAYGFGYYNSDAEIYDSIAYNAPYYLIHVAAGNARGYNGPPVDSTYYYNGNTKLLRSATLANNPTYISLSNTADAKNVLTVGAVSGLPGGYFSPSDVSIAYFSSWGPTNDGRIKPDVVADGVNVTSTWNTSNTAYSTQSGTSMATPNTTGSLYLLQEYFDRLHPSAFMRAATLKGLAIHTADQAGTSTGPDYIYGWGLLDVLKGANLITSSFNQQSDTIIESTLNNSGTYTLSVVASGKGPLVATLSWTDPPGTAVPVDKALNNPTLMLVNDLDMRISNGSEVFMPWVLDPSNPASAATRGDNFRDNVEKIMLDSVVPGHAYTITITHKGALATGSQAFSLLVSGIGGQAYCLSAPASSAGTRIDSVSISNLSIANSPGCTTYTNNTNEIIQVQPEEKLPIRIKLGSCDGTTANKIVKIYIDYNNNGVFDSTDLAAQSPVISGTDDGIYTDTLYIPQLTVGNTSVMRIVAEETDTAANVQPCGIYGRGETQDYSVLVTTPAHDLALAQLIAPANGFCSSDSEMVVITIHNSGLDTISQVPVTAVIQNGGNTVTTLNETYPGKIPPGFLVTYAFQETFSTVPGATYNITTYLSSPLDQNPSNDTLNNSVEITAQPAAPTATATASGDSITLQVTDPNPNATYFWYASATSPTPLFSTTDTTIILTAIPEGNTFYLSTGFAGDIGVKDKNVYPNGGSYQAYGGNWLSYTGQVPINLTSARLYTGNPGKVTIMVVDTVMDNGEIYYYVPALSSTTIDVYSTSPTPTEGARSNDPSDNGAVFYLNLPLPAGQHVIMDTTVDPSVDKSAIDSATIFRNNNVTGNPYPFTIPGVISITGNSATAAGNPNLYQSYYYYLYNMKLQTNDCISQRTPVSVSVPTNIAFKAFPNPNSGVFYVLFNAGTESNFQIELYDMLGRRCFLQNYSASGLFTTQIDVDYLVTGMYIVYVKVNGNTYKQKILIAR